MLVGSPQVVMVVPGRPEMPTYSSAIEAAELGRGGISYIARVLQCDRHTIRQGFEELDDSAALDQSRIRRPGGGRKPREEMIPELERAFLQVLQAHTAGSPMNQAINGRI